MPDSIISLTGPETQNPSDGGRKKKWKFRNHTGEPIHDFILRTGPVSFLEIEWPWGTTGNPPDIRKFTIREAGFTDGSKEFDDVVEGKATLDPPIQDGKRFEIEMEFDSPFEPQEYFEIIPTDANGVTIEKDSPTETAEPNTGTEDALDAAGKIIDAVSKMDAEVEESFASLRFDKERGKYVLAMRKGAFDPSPLQVKHVKRDHLEYEANYGFGKS